MRVVLFVLRLLISWICSLLNICVWLSLRCVVLSVCVKWVLKVLVVVLLVSVIMCFVSGVGNVVL